MITFEQISDTRSDCTASYKVELSQQCTVKEFINLVFKERAGEWGYIGIYKDKMNSFFGDPYCEYRYGCLLTTLPEEFLDKQIISVSGNGGWSRMDYLLEVV